MTAQMCSVPTLLDDFKITSDKVFVLQTHDPNDDTMNSFADIEGKIIILLYLEYHTYDWIEEILANSKSHYEMTGKLKNYYIIVHSHKYPQSLFDEYQDFFSFLYQPLIYNYYTDHFQKVELKKNIKFHFLSLNNRASVARQSLYYFFVKFNLIEKSYFSYLGELERSKYKSYDEISEEMLSSHTAWFCKNLDLHKLHNNIPFTIKGDKFEINDWSIGDKKYYEDTFCSVVFETYDDQPFPYFTEKIFKPIVFGHPFILHGNPGSLKMLQDLGFQTFANFWDEDYDSLAGNYRLEAIFHLLLEMSTWSVNKLEKLHREILPILEHNQNLFWSWPSAYKSIKTELFNDINQIIQNKIHLL